MSTIKQYAVEDIVKDVKVTIDEKQLNDAEFDGELDNQDMDEIIKSKIPDAITFVYANADYSLLDPNKVSSTTDAAYSFDTTSLVGKYKLGTDFVRLVYAKFGSWKRYIGQNELILWDDQAYAMLADKITTGTPDRPKVALAWDADGKCLELYKGGSATDTFVVGLMVLPTIGKITTGNKDAYSIPEKCYRSVIYYIAGLTLTTYREESAARLMFNEASDLMGFTQKISQIEQQVPQTT